MKIKNLIKTFLISCVAGIIGEGAIGWLIRLATGNFLWVYPESIFVTTSLYAIPLWGLAGLILYFLLQKIGVITNG